MPRPWVHRSKRWLRIKSEAVNVEPGYSPRSVSADGWPATHFAWMALFPLVCVLRCFLHGWLSIRDRCKKDKDAERSRGPGLGGV